MKHVKNLINHIKGCCEIVFSHSPEFKYAIKGIDLKNVNGSYSTLIYYQVVGTRHMQYATASQLNDSTLFTKFRPQEAQIIVAIATLEALMATPHDEFATRYKDYVTACASKLQLRR